MIQFVEFIFGQVVIWAFLYSGYILSAGHPVESYVF